MAIQRFTDEQPPRSYLVLTEPFDHEDGSISGESWHMTEAQTPEQAIAQVCGHPAECVVIAAADAERFTPKSVCERVPLRGQESFGG